MFTKIFPVWLVAIFAMSVYADDNVVCIGDNYEQGIPIPNVSLPTVSLTSAENVAQIYEGESLTLFANAIVDTQNGGNPNFYWCAEKGQLEIDSSTPDLNQVKYIAPTEVTEDTWVRVVVQLSDGLGYVSGKSLFLNISPLTYYFVEGYIYNTEGHAIPDALVEVVGHTVTTDAEGYYKINDLLPGNYTLTASKNDQNFVPVEITVGKNEPNKISLISDVPDIQEPPNNNTYLVYGTIQDKLNKPIVGVTVQVNDKTVMTDNTGYWNIVDLAEGEYTATASKDGYIFSSQDFAVGNNQNASVSFKANSVLDVKVIPNPRTAQQGENVTYTIIITNNGNETATGVVATDTLPSDTSLVSIEALDGGNCLAETVSCTLPDLTPGATATVKLVISNTQANRLVNTAKVTANDYPADMQTTWTKVIPYFSVSLSDMPDPVTMGGILHYTVEVDLSQFAPTDATGIKLVMQLPSGVELESATTDYGICNTSDLPTVICVINDLSIASAESISHINVNLDVVLEDMGLLLLTHEAKVTANEYPAHSVIERTEIFIGDVKVDMVFVIDTTHSMAAEINGVIAALKKFIAKIDPNQELFIVLVEFKDEVRYRAATRDLNVLLEAVENLEAEGGGTCPEASVEALTLAIEHLKDGGVILFTTDASPYADADLEKLGNLISGKDMNLVTILTGDCSNQDDWNVLPF